MSLIGKSIGNYLIKSKLGEGGMGAVYLGEHPLIGKRVAVKVLLEELSAKEDIVQRFFNEAKAVNDIGHQNIVDFGKIKLEGTPNDTVYFIMEFLEGDGLNSRLRRTGLSLAETMHVMEQCCSALLASHAKGIVHRDLKPENIYLCPRGGDKNFVKILDFGIAKLTGDGGMGQSQKTRTGLVIGTPAYMSPEQCEGKGQIDHRSDVYSMGVVMYELLTGRVPFPGEGFGEVLVAHLTKTPEPPSQLNPDIKPEIEAIVLHAIEKDRNRRFQNMDEFHSALKDPAAHMMAYRPLPGYTPSNGPSFGDNPTVVGQARPTGGPMTGVGARPTTLSGAAGEVEGGGGSSKTPVFIGLAVLLAAGGAGAFFLLKSKPNDKPAIVADDNSGQTKTGTGTEQPKVDQPVKVAESENVKITITTDPPGASVFRADTGTTVDGKTPVNFVLKRGTSSFDVQVKMAGFKTAIRPVNAEKDQAILVPMEPVEGKPVVAAVDPVPVKKEKGEKSSDPAAVKKPREKKGKKDGEGGGDDMKLLQPKF